MTSAWLPPIAVTFAPGLSWFVEPNGLLIVDELTRQHERLDAAPAAVWELLAAGQSLREVSDRLRWILAITPQEAQAHVERCLERWLERGWLSAPEPAGEKPER